MAAVRQMAIDGLNKRRAILVERVGTLYELRDTKHNVTTYGFEYRDPGAQDTQLPGTLYRVPVVHDARIAAICVAHGVKTLLARDRDFSLFPEHVLDNPFA